MSTDIDKDSRPLQIKLEINLIDLNKNDINVVYSAFGRTINNEQFLHAVLSGIKELTRIYTSFFCSKETGERGPEYKIHFKTKGGQQL